MYTELHVLIHRICYISTESDLKLVQKGSLTPVTLWFLFGSKEKCEDLPGTAMAVVNPHYS